MANENNAALGRNALVTDVDFSIGNSPTLSKADKRKSKLGRWSRFADSQPLPPCIHVSMSGHATETKRTPTINTTAPAHLLRLDFVALPSAGQNSG
jgi:hypothetical protein